MQSARRHAQQKMDILAKLGLSFEAEIIFEAHPVFREDQQTHTHADGRGRQRGDAELAAARKHLAPYIEDKKVEPVDKDIGAIEKGVDIGIDHALIEARNM